MPATMPPTGDEAVDGTVGGGRRGHEYLLIAHACWGDGGDGGGNLGIY